MTQAQQDPFSQPTTLDPYPPNAYPQPAQYAAQPQQSGPPQVVYVSGPAGAPANMTMYAPAQQVVMGAGGAPYVGRKQTPLAYALWLFLGLLGVHQFYLGKVGRGLLYLFTAGGFFVGWVIDAFTLPAQVRQVNTQRAVGLR